MKSIVHSQLSILRMALLVALAVLPATAQKRPFTFEDMMALKRVGDPAPSPDGKWVAFSSVNVSLEANTRTPHIWAVPVAGGEARQLTAQVSVVREDYIVG